MELNDLTISDKSSIDYILNFSISSLDEVTFARSIPMQCNYNLRCLTQRSCEIKAMNLKSFFVSVKIIAPS